MNKQAISHTPSKWRLACLVCCLTSLDAVAQQFEIRSFRQLPNDISAYITPEKDLNQEACALVKVVADKDFAFSSPLGIVRRKNDVGEVWLYLPKGSIQLTIKHPRWGVIRDYRFSTALESRLTYELVLNLPTYLPQRTLTPLEQMSIEIVQKTSFPTLLPEPGRIVKRPLDPISFLAIAHLGFSQTGPSGGIQLGVMRRHGAYIHLQTNFRAVPETSGECDRKGFIENGSAQPYYTQKIREARPYFLIGGLHHIASAFCLYEGIGYGRRTVIWETIEGKLLTNTAYSTHGLSAEVGGMWKFRHVVVSAGVMSIAANYWEATIGIGVHF